MREQIVEIALSRLKDLGKPFTYWSLAKLRVHLLEKRVVESISPEMLRKILAERGVSFQRTKTWKHSSDPDFERKEGLLLPSTVVGRGVAGASVSMSSARSSQSRSRVSAGPKGRPQRLRATYRRTQGIGYLFGS